jgi:wyosine [tRNA(Phe)-imidazoG37] synthetase (radical SAM superfamily)
MKCIFGPVNSRRLGRSLGIDLFSGKICNLNCLYCEVGTTVSPIRRRAAYTPTQAIIEEINTFCADSLRLASIDVFTITAKGEPTLHSGFGEILRHVKRVTDKPVAVLTNGTTLMLAEVRQDLMAADIVVPSLDAARSESFARVDRPAAGMDLQEIIDGLTLFSHEYRGRIWLEILFVQDCNDAPEDIEALLAAIKPMRLDRIQLNTVIRPPAEPSARAVSDERLAEIARIFRQELALPVDLPSARTEQVAQAQQPADLKKTGLSSSDEMLDAIVEMLQRRPCTAADINRTFQLGGPDKVEQLLEPLVNSGLLHTQEYGNERYYQGSSMTQ